MVYSARIEDRDYTFGVSGRLYKSNVLMYDHQTESLWSQLKETAIAGPMVGRKLEKIGAQRMKWTRWRQKHPQTLVLSTDTGHRRDYRTDPYAGYYRARGIMFPVGKVRADLAAKEMVLGVEVNGIAKAYPLSRLRKLSAGLEGGLEDRLGDTAIRIHLSAEGQVVEVRDRQDRVIPTIFAYWFAWQAFHPHTAVHGG